MKMINKILIIDDSRGVRKFISFALKEQGEIEEAENGLDGLEKAVINKYSLIMVDINMPIMDGIEFTQNFRKHNKETPVIILTTQQGEEKTAFEAGANMYLLKPITKNMLLDKIATFLEK